MGNLSLLPLKDAWMFMGVFSPLLNKVLFLMPLRRNTAILAIPKLTITQLWRFFLKITHVL